MTYPVIDWHGLYGEGWAEDIVPEAFSHPAKYSRALIRHIYQYLIDNHLIQRGSRILDPFGGVALGALDAQLQGLHWTGCELEPKFVALGQSNLALWQSKYAPHFARWGSARLVQGDSRRIAEVIAGSAGGLVSSPPYQELDVKTDFSSNPNAEKYHINPDQPGNGPREYGTSPGQLGAMKSGDFGGVIASPPFGEALDRDKHKFPEYMNDRMNYAYSSGNQGESDGNLAALKAEQDDFDAVIASPPFIQTSGGTNVTSSDGPLSDPSLIARHSAGNQARAAYGSETGQLQNMPEGDVSAVIRAEGIVSSPPYEGTGVGDLGNYASPSTLPDNAGDLFKAAGGDHKDYGRSEGQLGGELGDSFWGASLQIVPQCYSLLAPGGVAVWVCKDYVRKGKRVPFSDQWRMLCEKCGFITLTEVHAWVIEDNGVQLGMMETDDKHHKTERKSFFRRLAERKGSPRIDWETVWIMRKEIGS